MTLTLAVVMWLVGRILKPLAKLTRAAEFISRGQLARSRPLVAEFAERRDEIGGLARAQLQATTRLHTVVKASQRLARHIESSVDTIDGVAKTVASAATRQEERLTEVTSTLEPLTRGAHPDLAGAAGRAQHRHYVGLVEQRCRSDAGDPGYGRAARRGAAQHQG